MQTTSDDDIAAFNEIRANRFYLAVATIESSLNPNAVSRTSTARGIFMLIEATRKALGVSNWKSVSQQLKAFKTLVKQHQEIFKTDDPEILYAAHYLGATILRKHLNNLVLTPKQKGLVTSYNSIIKPRFKRIYDTVTTVPPDTH